MKVETALFAVAPGVAIGSPIAAFLEDLNVPQPTTSWSADTPNEPPIESSAAGNKALGRIVGPHLRPDHRVNK
jgi:hypothetical protein